MLTQSQDTTRVLLAVPHAGLRQALRKFLQSIDGVRVAGEATSGRQAMELARHFAPDIALIDFCLRDMRALEVTSAMVREMPKTEIIMLGDSDSADEEAYREAAMSRGASAYVACMQTSTQLWQSLLEQIRRPKASA